MKEAEENPRREKAEDSGWRHDLRCPNSRCICHTEQELPPAFRLTDREAGIWRCVYCEQVGVE